MNDDQDQPLGPIIDGLGVAAHLADGELAAAAVVLLKVLQADGSTRLSLAYSDGLGWIERAGMLRVAELIESSTTSVEGAS
ncbi:hypothetical protein C7C46_08890 [Streptomyces tateyamensis]|uniref:Uncharacterized protein n=1 Tax=Streptomyces tateyamensis TaxID=565073 RepID=A0A2V4NE67_9ACTN|nr:hypothetical protein [Streptomyces tateyamensis]PYC83439.1 hypothetical protein C7C46_08890 [Streptomyces tateyamensis]